jgi:hypothetical protein
VERSGTGVVFQAFVGRGDSISSEQLDEKYDQGDEDTDC